MNLEFQSAEWQSFGKGHWQFGIKIRGIIREASAIMTFDSAKMQWRCWTQTNKRNNEQIEFHNSLLKGVQWCEKTLGM